MSDLKYNNTETKHTADGKTIVRKVVIHGGKGHKSVSVRSRMGKSRTAKRPLSDDEIRKICAREFIPGLFADCERTPERGTSEGVRAIRGMRHMEHSTNCERTPERGTSEGVRAIRGMRHTEHSVNCEKADAQRKHHCSGMNCRVCHKSATLKRAKHLGGRKPRNNQTRKH